VIAKVNGTPWDLTRVLEDDCTLELLKFTDDEGRDTFWHSSAHILGQALELFAGGELCYGPEIESGFYYDTYEDAPLLFVYSDDVVVNPCPFLHSVLALE
jgi:threonyl-tRNA synthetase